MIKQTFTLQLPNCQAKPYYFFAAAEQPSLVLFDTAPGGAGFVHEVKEHLSEVLQAAVELLNCNFWQ